MAVMMPLAWAGCCWAWGFWMLRLPLRAWRNSVGLLEVGMVAREKEKERLEVGSRGLEPGSKNAGRAKVCAQRTGECSCSLVCSALLWRWGGSRGEGRPDSSLCLCSSARCAWAVRRAVVRAGRKSLKGSGAPSNRQSANRRSSRGAGQQPTEAGTERGSVAAWLAWAAPTSTGSWPPIVGYLDRQLETESLSPRPRRWSGGQWTLEERSGWAKTRAVVEETHGESTAARELVFIVHSIAPCLGPDLQVRIIGSALRAPISRQ